MKNYIVTGSTSGLGLKIVEELATDQENRIFMAVRDQEKGQEIVRGLGEHVQVRRLDLSDLSQIAAFVRSWEVPLNGLINNAGVQHVRGTHFTPDGYEETVAVNHLAAFMLTVGLKSHLAGGRVLFMGSGTHNPKHVMARLSGFRGAQYTSMGDLLAGKSAARETRQMNLDRYATSKLLNLVSAVEFSRRYGEFSCYVLDPGLMPGTGLARNHNGLERFLWNTILPVMGPLLPDTSTPERSAKTAAWIMSASPLPFQSGDIISFNRKPYGYVWEEKVFNETIRQEVYESSMRILKSYLGPYSCEEFRKIDPC